VSSQLLSGRVLTHPGHRPSAKATVTISGDKIAAVDAAGSSAGDDLLIMPALADAHDHGRGLSSLAYGVQDQPLELWLPLLGREPLVDPYHRAAVAFGRLARSGVAAINHCHNPQRLPALVDEAKAVARAAHDVGVRVAFAVPLRDRNHLALGDTAPLAAALGPSDFQALDDRIVRVGIDEQLARVDEIAAFEHPLFGVQYGLVGVQWCSDALMERVAAASTASGRRIHMHLLETQRQRQWTDANYPGGVVRRLDEIGLLSERLTVAHGVWLRRDECELLAERGVTVSVNTSSNLRLRSGIAPVALFQAARLSWAIGLDGMAVDEDADALREMRLVWCHQQGTGLKGALSRRELCDAMFVNGRRTITPAAGGAIEPGLAADLVVLDRPQLTADALAEDVDELDFLLTRGRKDHVRGLIVAGRTIVEDGVVRSVDLGAIESELWAQARKAWPDAMAGDGLRQRHWNALADFYGCDCHRVS
jgi:5-methylthioadenosine/S-adenosylhomocysteine deaminase